MLSLQHLAGMLSYIKRNKNKNHEDKKNSHR